MCKEIDRFFNVDWKTALWRQLQQQAGLDQRSNVDTVRQALHSRESLPFVLKGVNKWHYPICSLLVYMAVSS